MIILQKTKRLLKNFTDYSNLKLANVKNRSILKEKVCLILVRSALHNHLLFTDADCIPAQNWI